MIRFINTVSLASEHMPMRIKHISEMVLAGIIAGGASLAGTGASISSTGKLNKKNRRWQQQMYYRQVAESDRQAQEARDYQRELIDDERAYNDPSAQVARLKDAGLNPSLAYGGSTDNAAQVSAGNTPINAADVPPSQTYNADFSGITQAGSGLASLLLQDKGLDIQKQDADTRKYLSEYEALKYAAETKLIDEEQFGAALDNLFKKSTLQDRIALVSQELENSQQEFNVMLSEVGVNEAQAAKLTAEADSISRTIDLTIKKLNAEIDLLKNQSALTSRQAITESNKLRLMYTENLRNVAEAKLADIQKRLAQLGLPKAEEASLHAKFEYWKDQVFDIIESSTGAVVTGVLGVKGVKGLFEKKPSKIGYK